MSDVQTGWLVLAIVSVVVFLIASGTILAVEFGQAPGQMAKIEQCRKDVLRVGRGANEDVVGQATEWNQKIKSKQKYNSLWWSDLYVPDSWDDVELIEIPNNH